MFDEWIRRSGFWILDFAKGSPVRKHLLDIRFIMENIDSPETRERQNSYLSSMLAYATEYVPFYRALHGQPLDSFPIVDKTVIKENYDDFQSSEFRNKRVYELHTSGSTGTPFVVRQDVNKRKRVYAEMMYFWGKAGFKIGQKYVFFRIWTDLNRKGRLAAWARNIVMHDILLLDHDNLESVRQKLKTDNKVRMLLSYASTFENLATFLQNQGDIPEMFSVETIISTDFPHP